MKLKTMQDEMPNFEPSIKTRKSPVLPNFVVPVLSAAARHLMRKQIRKSTFRRQIRRISVEELEPRGLALKVGDSAPEEVQYAITTPDGKRLLSVLRISQNKRSTKNSL